MKSGLSSQSVLLLAFMLTAPLLSGCPGVKPQEDYQIEDRRALGHDVHQPSGDDMDFRKDAEDPAKAEESAGPSDIPHGTDTHPDPDPDPGNAGE
jgi:hypothetical protein